MTWLRAFLAYMGLAYEDDMTCKSHICTMQLDRRSCKCTDLNFVSTCDLSVCAAWLTHMCDMTCTDSYVWHDLFSCVPWLIHICDVTRQPCAVSVICEIWLDHKWDKTLSASLDQTWDMTVTWLNPNWDKTLCVCDMTQTDSYVWHDLFMCATW